MEKVAKFAGTYGEVSKFLLQKLKIFFSGSMLGLLPPDVKF